MNKYTFEFEDLLNIKIQKEDNIKNQLSKENKVLEKKKNELNRLLDLKEEELNNFNNKGKSLKVSDIEVFYTYIDNLEEKIKLKKSNINMLETKIEKIREKLIEISKEKQIFEKIREEEYEEYKKELQKDELKTNDEIVNYKYFANNI